MSFNFVVQLDQSNEWLIQDDVDSALTDDIATSFFFTDALQEEIFSMLDEAIKK